MINTNRLLDFTSFLVEKRLHQRESLVEKALAKIESEFGSLKNPDKFLAAVKAKGGVDGMRTFVQKVVEPYVEDIIQSDKKNGIKPDYDDIIRGLVSSVILETQLHRMTKTNKSK